jgi:hypothetical protein
MYEGEAGEEKQSARSKGAYGCWKRKGQQQRISDGSGEKLEVKGAAEAALSGGLRVT